MSDLQLSLLVIGAMVIGGVYAYNLAQERRFRRRLEQAFGEAPDDVLLRRGAAATGDRVEPQLSAAAARAAGPARIMGTPAGAAVPVAAFDPQLDYVAEIQAAAPLSAAAVAALLSKVAECGKRVRVLGRDVDSGDWEEVARGVGRHDRLQVGVQLVNRAGSLDASKLTQLCEAVRDCAERSGAEAECPDPQAALKDARELDAFCSGVDVAIGVNIVAEEGAQFAGAGIRALAESAGLKLEPDGVFHYRGEDRRTLFTLDNHEPAPFLPEQIKSITTRGVTLMLDVPRVPDGAAALDRMLEIAHGLAAALGGRLVDDNRAALSDAGLATIREQLHSIHAALAARGLAAGGERALRLFS